jgi:hypothetical protein
MLNEITTRQDPGGRFVGEVSRDGDVLYTTDPQVSGKAAHLAAAEWLEWFEGIPHGSVESIYYILVVPETWPGPPPGAHPYSGLHFKIGRTNNVLRRVANLQTGTSGELIVHALEPGSADVEAKRHELFAAERRQGEWFAASPQLCQHVFETWRRNNALPPEHQAKLARLVERIHAYRAMRQALGDAPDMVNPSLNEPWRGKVFVDLVYTRLLGNDG